MEFPRPLCLLLVLLTFVSSSHASKFYVGGSAGWVPNPSESYSQWAGRNRFKINDTLVFKYQKGSDSVLQVTKEDYDKCNKTKPIKKFEDGNTEFTLDRSGPFYFISGKDQNCENGQKLNVVVLTPRGSPPPPPISPSPPPSPSGSPPAPAHAPSGHPPSPSVSPSPTASPTPASGPSPATSPAPAGKSPSSSPALSPGPVSGPPATSPATSPSPAGKSPSPSPPAGSPGPVSGPPTQSPPSPSSPASSPPSPSAPAGLPSSPSPGSRASPGGPQTPSSNVTAPPPAGSEGWAAVPSSLLVYSATIVVGAVLLR